MSNKKLSIIVLFCDKDKQYIPELLKQIRAKVKIPHEVVLIDNCTDPIEPEGDDFKYYAFGYNAYQTMGRKKGVELASGDYTWFVDADDELLTVSAEDVKLLEENNDLVVFNVRGLNLTCPEIEKDFVVEGDLLQPIFYRAIVKTLWNKWIRTGILRKVEKAIPKNSNTCALEDSLLWLGSLFYGKRMKFTTKAFYLNRFDRGYTGRKTVDSVEAYKLHTRGFVENRDIISKNFLVNRPAIARDVKCTTWYMSRLLVLPSKEMLEECIDIYLKDCISDKKTLVEDFENVYFFYSKKRAKQYDWLLAAFQKRYPDDPDFDIERIKAKYPFKKPVEFVPVTKADSIVAEKLWSILVLEKALKRLENISIRECN